MTDIPAALLQSIRCAADILRASQRTAVLTGAGISTSSGIPDFRSTNSGLWEVYDPFEVASLSSFRYNPERFFEWLRTLAGTIHGAQPNAAHYALAKLQNAGYIKTLITQNIDGLHQRAGSNEALEIHGTLETLTCIGCYAKVDTADHMEAYLNSGIIPLCPSCNKILKPDVILMGEQLPVRTWLKAQEACKTCDLMIVAGSSLEVLPVAGLPMRAIENGAHLIIINHSSTYLDVRADVVFHEDVAEIIPRIAREVLGD